MLIIEYFFSKRSTFISKTNHKIKILRTKWVTLRYYLSIVFFVIAATFSCKVESVNYPPEPQIEYLGVIVSVELNALEQMQTGIELSFYLIDGDGDVGLTQSDTFPPYDVNFFPTLFGIKDGDMKVDTNLIANKYRIPDVGELGQDNTLKATIIVDLVYPYNSLIVSPYDSVVYSFYMIDRALNKSNIAWTDTIIIPEF